MEGLPQQISHFHIQRELRKEIGDWRQISCLRQNVGPGRSACTRDVICLALPAVHFNPSFLITTAAVAAVVLSLNAHSMHFIGRNFGRI